MQMHIFDRVHSHPEPLRMTLVSAKKLINSLGVDYTLCLYLRSICEPLGAVQLIANVATQTIFRLDLNPTDATIKAAEFFNFLDGVVNIGHDDAKLLLELRVKSIVFNEDQIFITTELSEEEYEKALELNGPPI